jgi:hypothetical protein
MMLVFAACGEKKERVSQVDETYAAIKTFFIPDGAEIVTDEENILIINSTQPFFELIEFYENTCRKLVLHEAEINDTQDGIWIFSGIYHGFYIHQRASGFENGNRERYLYIELRDMGTSVEIEIIY